LKKSEKKLLETWRKLSDSDQQAVQQFAEFLLQKNGPVEQEVASEPLDIERPAEESVIAAIRRLSETYPMINKDKMINETSSLMAQHVIHGKDAAEVIDELEIVFRNHYEMIRQGE
jgi:hypothetical protein